MCSARRCLSTAEINESVLGCPLGRCAVPGGCSRRRAMRGAPSAYAATHGIPRAHGLVRGAARGRTTSTRSTSRSRMLSTSSGRCARWRRASTCSSRSRSRGSRSRSSRRGGRPSGADSCWSRATCGGTPADAASGSHSLPELGELQAIHSWFFDPVLREHDVRFVPELGGGALLDLGCYCVGACVWLPGASRTRSQALGAARSRRRRRALRGDAAASATSPRRSRAGSTARLNTLEVIGTNGFLRVPHAFSDPDGVVLVNGDRASRRARAATTASSSPTSAPRSEASERRSSASRHAGPGTDARRPAAFGRSLHLTGPRAAS